MSKILVTVDHQFVRTPDGRVWVKTIYGKDFWSRYLKVFDTVKVACRIRDVEKLEEEMLLSSLPGVDFFQLPQYRGPKEFLFKYRAIKKAIKGIADDCQCALYRIPSPIVNSIHGRVKKKKIPWAVEIVNDPWDTFAPGAFSGIVRPVVRIYFTVQVKRMAKKANGASYVTENALQRRYPSYVQLHGEDARHFCSYYSSIILNKEYFYYEREAMASKKRFTLVHVNSCITDYSKGHDVVIRVLKRLCDEGLDVSVKFVGDGPMRSTFEDMSEEYGVKDRVIFTGLLSGAEAVREELIKADILLFPTKGEGLPRTVIEGMAVGLPCLSTPVNGIPELLTEDCMFEQQDDIKFAAKTKEILLCDDLYRQISRRNIKKAEEYLDEVLSARRSRFYQRLSELGE